MKCLFWKSRRKDSLEQDIGEWEDNDPVVVFSTSKVHKCREKGWDMRSKNISVVNVRTYWQILCGWCYKYKNCLTFDEQLHSLSILHVTKVLSSQNIVGTCCLHNVMRVVIFSSFSFICRYMIFMSVLSSSFHMKLAAMKGFKIFLTEA
jgi:hypothetical protein